MTDRTWLFNDQPDGTTATAANVLATDGTTANQVAPGTGNTITFSSEHPHQGGRGLKVATAATSTSAIRFPYANGHRAGGFSVYRWVDAAVSMVPITVRRNGGVQFRIQLDGSNRVQLQNGSGTGIGVSTASVTPGRLNRFDVAYDLDAGTITVNVYNGDATGTPDVTVTVTGQSAQWTTDPVIMLDLGTPGSAVAANQWFDSLVMRDHAASAPGPYIVANQPPVATIGSGTPTTAVQNATVPLRGTATDPDGTATLAWSWVSYPSTVTAPVITNPTSGTTASFKPVGPGDYVVRLTATDNNGATATADRTITVTEATGGGDNVEYLVRVNGTLI